MKKAGLSFTVTLVVGVLLALQAQPASGSTTFEVIDADQAYQRTMELCSSAKTIGSYLKQSVKALRFYWAGIRSGGPGVFPSKRTMELMRNPGYWRALNECYGSDAVVSQYTFSIAIGLLDDLGGLTDSVVAFYAVSKLVAALGASRLAVSHPKLFARVGGVLFGTSVVATITAMAVSVRTHFKYKKMMKEVERYGDDPEKLFGDLVDKDHLAVNEILQERRDEINHDLKSDLSTSRRSQLEQELKTLEDVLQRRFAS